ncbi:MAG: type II secretion system protein GspK [Candidatus Electrothrix sp. GW3-4]|uniref:general secretion pathway protein GspK n=1 Tax=Candidatus Electrothrix sp. GW3-4 TaxID=3126740 RepID=UPI0030CF85EF
MLPASLFRDRSGMALVLTLLAISFLVAVTVQLSTSVNGQMQAAANQSTAVRLDAMLLSGLNLARAALLADQKENEDTADSQFDRWGTLDSALLSELFSGSLDITVTDLSGRLQANALVWTEKEKAAWKKKQKGKNKKKDPAKLQRILWKRFLLRGNLGIEGLDEDQATTMLDSLVDWLDADDEKEENGAEKEYYSSLDPPYIPTNGPMPIIEDLLLVKGWEQKILYSELKKKDNSPSHLIAYLTNGEQPGMVNINTAPALVLQALHEEMTEELAADMVSYREDENNKELLNQVTWYRNVPGFPGSISFDQTLITTASNLFKITVTAADKGLQRTGEGIIQRKENQEQALLYWKIQ